MDIKNSLELIDAVTVLGNCLKEAKRDGKINIWDLPKFAPMLAAAQKALKDSEQVPLELKDADSQEIQVLVDKLFVALTSLAAAVLEKPL